MAMTAIGSLLAVLAGFLRDLTQLAISPSGSSVLTAVAATILAGAVFATILALLTAMAGVSRTTAAIPMTRRASALREKSWRAASVRQRDPDAAGRPRPRARSAAQAAAPPLLSRCPAGFRGRLQPSSRRS